MTPVGEGSISRSVCVSTFSLSLGGGPAHIVHTAESHGIDASLMRVVEGLSRRVVAEGHGADGFVRVTGLLSRHAH